MTGKDRQSGRTSTHQQLCPINSKIETLVWIRVCLLRRNGQGNNNKLSPYIFSPVQAQISRLVVLNFRPSSDFEPPESFLDSKAGLGRNLGGDYNRVIYLGTVQSLIIIIIIIILGDGPINDAPITKGNKIKLNFGGSNYVQLINTEKGFVGVFFFFWLGGGSFGFSFVTLLWSTCYRLTKLS